MVGKWLLIGFVTNRFALFVINCQIIPNGDKKGGPVSV